MGELGAQTRDILSFGDFHLVANERLLMRDGSTLPLGGRTLDILIALVSSPNQALSKRDLLAQVWPDVTVGEGSLRFHIASLRKALGDGQDGARYITTLAGRGYCFVAPIARSNDRVEGPAQAPVSTPFVNIPPRLTRMVGRADGVLALSTQLAEERFVTFSGAVLFVDLGAQTDPRMVATSIASMLGLSVQSDDPSPDVIAYLHDKRVLLVLDTCEHLMDMAASLAGRLYISAPQVHILATSREALRVEGEHVHKLEPLGFPPEDLAITAETALTYPAVQLFVERAAASGARLNLCDADAAIVAGICRKLDGLALPIELAAGRVGTYGLQQTAALLEDRLSLLWEGQRTAPLRQQTLKATLDWSYGLLSDLERQVLRQLAVFTGYFSLEAARAVLTCPALDEGLVINAVDSLVAKSMVATFGVGATMRYRLLETTRTYTLEVSPVTVELAELTPRHAIYYRSWLERTAVEWPTLATAAERSLRQADLANVRAALEWCFGADGDEQIGIALAAAASRVFWAMSLLAESHRWAERAVRAIDVSMRGSREEMQLQAALGMSFMFSRGEREPAHAALTRSLEIAEERGDAKHQLQLLVPMSAFYTRQMDFGTALKYAKTGVAIAETIDDAAALAVARTLLGMTLHFMGDLSDARVQLDAALKPVRGRQPNSDLYLGSGHHIWAGLALSRTLWFQGRPDQALERAREAIQEAANLDVSLSLALHWSVPVFLWTGELQEAETHMDWHNARVQSHSTAPEFAIGRGMKGQLEIYRGDAKEGVELLQSSLEALGLGQYELRTGFNISLAQGFVALDRPSDALVIVNDSIACVEKNGDFSFMPELLRLKGAILLLLLEESDEAEACFSSSLELSRRQGATAWELRTSTDLAAHWASQGRRQDARMLLEPVFSRFVEGLDTSDVQAAGRLLATLN